ncbi:hypothetical protein MHYP_G00324670 [Metynnis hypsauchen]
MAPVVKSTSRPKWPPLSITSLHTNISLLLCFTESGDPPALLQPHSTAATHGHHTHHDTAYDTITMWHISASVHDILTVDTLYLTI